MLLTAAVLTAIPIDIVLVVSFSPYSAHRIRHHTRCVLLAIILAAGILTDIVLVTLYCAISRCLCHFESYTNHVTKLATVILVASYSPLYSPHCTRHHTRRILLAIVLAAGILIDIEYSSRCIVQLPAVSVTLRATLTMSQSSPLSYSSRLTRHYTRSVLL